MRVTADGVNIGTIVIARASALETVTASDVTCYAPCDSVTVKASATDTNGSKVNTSAFTMKPATATNWWDSLSCEQKNDAVSPEGDEPAVGPDDATSPYCQAYASLGPGAKTVVDRTFGERYGPGRDYYDATSAFEITSSGKAVAEDKIRLIAKDNAPLGRYLLLAEARLGGVTKSDLVTVTVAQRPAQVHFAPFLAGCGSCPDAPTGYAEPGIRGEITVHWTPATTGRAATSWHIRYTRVTHESNPFNQPQNVTHVTRPASARSYTISGLEPGVSYAVLIMGWGGDGYGDAAVASLAAGAVPLPGPPFFDARVTGDILRIRIRGDLDTGSRPLGSAFEVTASQYGVTRTINGSRVPKRSVLYPDTILDPVRIMDASFANFRFMYVYVMLTESVRRGETVTVSYTRPTQNPLQDRSGNRHTYSFSNKPVANHTRRDSSDTTPPTFTSAEVKKPSDRFAVTETTLLVTFNQELDIEAAGTAGSAFSVTVTNPNTNAARTIEGKGTVGTGERNNLGYLVPNAVANVTLDGRILRRETVTVSYTQPSENPLQDENGNAVATFTGRTVSNNVPLPMATRAQVMPNGQSQYNRLIVTFDQELDDNSSPASAFVMTSRYTLTRPIDGAQVEREHTHTGTGTPTRDLRQDPGSNPGQPDAAHRRVHGEVHQAVQRQQAAGHGPQRGAVVHLVPRQQRYLCGVLGLGELCSIRIRGPSRHLPHPLRHGKARLEFR